MKAAFASWLLASPLLGLLLSGTAMAHEGHAHPEPAAAPPAEGEAKPKYEVEAVLEKPERDGATPPAPPAEAVPPPPPVLPPVKSVPDVEVPHHSLPATTWRRSIRRRGDAEQEWFDAGHLFFELRFGPYFPEVDEEFEGTGQKPFEQFFGDSPQFYFGLELDWLPVRIPYVGSIGGAFGWGYTRASGKTVTEAGAEAGSDTALTIFPMHASAVVRFDGPLRDFNFPLVPYGKVGLGFAPWRATGPDGTSSAGGVEGTGTSLGLHLAVGGALALNAFDPTTAVAMYQETGIRYAYLWGEWMWANLDGFGGDAMHVGTSTGVVGLALEW